MYTYRMTVSYDGTRYRGWQRQENTKQTIQRCIEEKLSTVCGECINISGSGRTDSGVHAFAQEVSFRVSQQLEIQDTWKQLNEMLPEDIRVIRLETVADGFHARKSAVGKCYEYHVDLSDKPDVFSRRYCFHFPKKLDEKAMQAAAEYLKGTHDFASFTDSKETDDTVRTIYDIKIQKIGPQMILSFYGDGFLYHMVRILTGTLLDVGAGVIPPEKIREILFGKDRKKSGFPAPARGLFLKEVYYEERG